MEYVRFRWLHAFPNEPDILQSELDVARNEIRKVEIFRGGQPGFASSEPCGGNTTFVMSREL